MVKELKKQAQFTISVPSIQSALRELVRQFGHDPALIPVDDLQVIADKLSAVARKDPPWGWRYLRNVLNGKIEPSEKLTQAIMALGARFDGVPDLVTTARPVNVLAVGNIKPGALVLANSRPCANPACPIEFVPVTPCQLYCNPACRKKKKH